MLKFNKVWVLVYDNNDTDGSNNDGGDGGTNNSEQKPNLKTLIEKHGLQDELNGMMASNRKNLNQKNQELIAQLQNLRDQATMTTQAKEELEARIDELQSQYMSKEELAKREADKAAKIHAQELEKLTSETGKWKDMYATSTIQRALLDAAVAGEAVQPAQIVSMLGQTTQLVEEVDAAGVGTGKYKPVVKFNDVGQDGQQVTLDLSPSETIKRMKELPELYGNLFKGEASGGFGGNSNAQNANERQPKLNELLKDPKKYADWRKKNPDLDISKLR